MGLYSRAEDYLHRFSAVTLHYTLCTLYAVKYYCQVSDGCLSCILSATSHSDVQYMESLWTICQLWWGRQYIGCYTCVKFCTLKCNIMKWNQCLFSVCIPNMSLCFPCLCRSLPTGAISWTQRMQRWGKNFAFKWRHYQRDTEISYSRLLPML